MKVLAAEGPAAATTMMNATTNVMTSAKFEEVLRYELQERKGRSSP